MGRASLCLCFLVLACQSKGSKTSLEDSAPGQAVSSEVAPVVGPQESVKQERPEQKAVRLPGVLEPAAWLEGATRVAAVQNAAGEIRIVGAGANWFKTFTPDGRLLGEHQSPGAALVLEPIDVDGDGLDELALGRGLGVGLPEGPMSLEVIALTPSGAIERVERIDLPSSSRPQMVAVSAVPGVAGQLWAAHFVSKFQVQVARYVRDSKGRWRLAESRGEHRVVGDMSVLANGQPVIARFYGATADDAGGVYLLEAEGKNTQLPSTRGARAVLAIPGENKVVMADGWHKKYGKLAKGLLTVVAASKDLRDWQEVAGASVRGNYGFNQLRLGDVHRSSGLEVIASGNGAAVVFLPTRPDLLFELSGAEAVDAFPVQLKGDTRMEVVIAGPTPVIWSPR